MKSSKLFGIIFSQNEKIKAQLFKTHEDRKREELKVYEEYFGKDFAEKRYQQELMRGTPIAYQAPLHFGDVKELLNETCLVHYYITTNVLLQCERVKTKNPFDLSWLKPLEDGKRQLNFGDRFFRYNKIGPKIFVLYATYCGRGEMGYIEFSFFNMHLETGEINISSSLTHEEGISKEELAKHLFFQMVTFIDLSPTEEIYLPAGRKHGHKKSAACLLNESSFPIIIVDTNWNRVIHREGFEVEGHYRLQACGPQFSQRRLTWIDSFNKEGYNLSATKKRRVS